MKKIFLFILIVISACTSSKIETTTVPAKAEDIPTVITEESEVDYFSFLPVPTCPTMNTPPNQEGPYFKPGTPENSHLFVDGMMGEKLILIGRVLTENCEPIADAKLDFWQTDFEGNYDNDGFTFRGHQFTDDDGRYILFTVVPGLYDSRPIKHIHVKVTIPGGKELITQLYFPDQPIDDLTIQMEQRNGYYLGTFNFVLPE